MPDYADPVHPDETVHYTEGYLCEWVRLAGLRGGLVLGESVFVTTPDGTIYQFRVVDVMPASGGKDS